jgi:hypothetical protein
VQHLTSQRSTRVPGVISTIQRVYSILRGDEELPEELDEQSLFELDPSRRSRSTTTPRCRSRRST